MATAAEKDGAVHIRVSAPILHPYTLTKPVPYTIEVPAREGEPKRHETRWERKRETKYMVLMRETELVVDGKEVRASRKNGQVVEPRQLPKLLSKETPVLVFTRGKIDPDYLQMIQDQVLIIVIAASKDFPGRTKADK
jgi:hypothetical protein